MKSMAALGGVLLLLAQTDVVRAANMFAGPLFPAGGDTCECEIVNVSASAKNVQILIFDGLGQVLGDSGTFSLPAGQTGGIGSGANGSQYCKFVGASASSFRASIACFASGPTSAGSDFVALPAR